MSGCRDSIPLEASTDNPDSDCLHWSERCFGNELMTPLTNGDMKLSRLTVATLEDLGYLVNYDGADSFSAADLDASCRCNRRLGHGGGGGEDTPKVTGRRKRKLSTAEMAPRKAAFNFGKERLQDNVFETEVPGNLKNVGSEIVSVFFKVPEASQIAHVIVKGTDRP